MEASLEIGHLVYTNAIDDYRSITIKLAKTELVVIHEKRIKNILFVVC